MSDFHKKVWRDFCRKKGIIENGLELFETQNDLTVTLKQIGRKIPRKVLKRNETLDGKFLEFCRDIEEEPSKYDGLLYIMYSNTEDNVIPHYIGKTETYGKSGEVSSLITGSNIPRWDDGEYYHIGGLSSMVIKDFPNDKKRPSYEKWAKMLFNNFPSHNLRLNKPIYLWIHKWRSNEAGIWEEFGYTPLPMIESMLIGLCYRLFPEQILNTEGITRRKS